MGDTNSIYLGGGFAVSKASETSGLSNYIGQQLEVVKQFSPTFILSIVVIIATFATEVSSNTAVVNILLPVLAKMVRNVLKPRNPRKNVVVSLIKRLFSVSYYQSESPLFDVTRHRLQFLCFHATCGNTPECHCHGRVQHENLRHGRTSWISSISVPFKEFLKNF